MGEDNRSTSDGGAEGFEGVRILSIHGYVRIFLLFDSLNKNMRHTSNRIEGPGLIFLKLSGDTTNLVFKLY